MGSARFGGRREAGRGCSAGPRGPFGGEAGRSQACGAGLAKGRQAGPAGSGLTPGSGRRGEGPAREELGLGREDPGAGDVDLVHAGAGTSQRRCGAGLLVHEAGDAGGLGSEGAEERRRWRGLLLDPRDEEEDGALVPELAKQDGGGLRRSGRGPGRSGSMVRRPWRSLRRRRAGGSCPRQREIPEREMNTEGGGRTREGG